MLRLLKHEIKGRYKTFLIMLIGLFLLNLLIMQKISGLTVSKDIMIWTILSGILNVGTVTMLIIDGFRLLQRDLSSETGYSIFTLPIRSHSILFSKIILTVVELTILLIEIKFITLIILGKQFGSLSQNLIFLGIILVLYIGLLIVIYFAQTVGKLSINNLGYGKLITAAVIFGVTYGVVFIDQYLSDTFPSNIILTIIKEGRHNMHSIQANIASLIFEVCVAVILFVSTAYLIEKKVDI